MVKQTLRRRRPGFNESFHGFRSFNAMLEEAAKRGWLTLERDSKSGGYILHPVEALTRRHRSRTTTTSRCSTVLADEDDDDQPLYAPDLADEDDDQPQPV